MSIAKVIEVIAESPESYDAAVLSGIEQASETVEDIQSAWVKDHEVVLGEGASKKHRVHLKVTFLVNQP